MGSIVGATTTSDPVAQPEMVVYCFQTLVGYLSGHQNAPEPRFQEAKCPLFVTWEKINRSGQTSLRGCIGTLEARHIRKGLYDYALTSSQRDRRFSPIQLPELENLRCTVSLLTNYERGNNHLDWEIGVHGLIIHFQAGGREYSATYLPEVALHEGWSKQQTIESLIRKSGYDGPVTEPLLQNCDYTRYQSSLKTLTYQEFLQHGR
eukprot:CAMPEP_0197845324 /NCGR_PEP_ID=MMETSP1438-20131217/2271_1 /TAXON_ID=1461541 /ORGANISM="Pterosperma sp., Strain CCMP1384" /LENGTH=205 /DNA_ID=CAMNT_0043456575 /DNA_START=137 /DNA_END=754 /DNA_ORIENTATION=+